MRRELILEVLNGLIALLFAYTAASKFLDYNKFVFQMRLAPLPMMKTIAPVLGILVPTVEAFIVIGLLFKSTRKKALFATVLLLIVFEIYIAWMMSTGLHLPCTCGGIVSEMGWEQHLVFNLVFLLIAVTGILLIRQNEKQARSGV